MPCEILIHAINHSKAIKGQIASIKEAPAVWGQREGLPNYVILTISDRTAEQVKQYSEQIKNIFNWDLLNSNASGRRYRIWIAQNILNFKPGEGLRNEIRDYLINEYNASLISYNPPNEAVFDIPNTDWVALKNNIVDRFEVIMEKRRWRFSEADVDTAIISGGKVTLNGIQAASKLIDRIT
jgi:hypothetical protein